MPYSGIVQARTPTLMAGRLRHKIDIVNVSPCQDENGSQWQNKTVLFANVWATVQALNGTDKFAAHEFVSQATHEVIIRYMPGVNSGQEIVFGTRIFQCKCVLNPDERNKMLILLCVEINDSSQQNPIVSG
jgi:SPP1 family predicted phage head-tail adaptor